MAGNVQQSNTALTGATNAQNSIIGNEASGLSTTVNSLFSNPNVQNGINQLFNNGSGAQQMTGFAPVLQPGQVGVGGFVAPTAPAAPAGNFF